MGERVSAKNFSAAGLKNSKELSKNSVRIKQRKDIVVWGVRKARKINDDLSQIFFGTKQNKRILKNDSLKDLKIWFGNKFWLLCLFPIPKLAQLLPLRYKQLKSCEKQLMYWNLSMTPNIIYPIIFPLVLPTNTPAPESKPSTTPQHCQSLNLAEEQGQNQSSYLDLKEEDLIKAGYQPKKKAWSEEEDKKLKKYYEKDQLDWPEIATLLPGRNAKMCYSRYRRLETQTKLQWKKTDDAKLCKLVEQLGENWRQISKHFQKRTHKQVKEHYMNYLRPQIRKDQWTLEEDLLLVDLLNKNGKNWKIIEEHFPGRTQNQIKNRYFGRLKKLAQKKTKEAKGIDGEVA